LLFITIDGNLARADWPFKYTMTRSGVYPWNNEHARDLRIVARRQGIARRAPRR
jgi:hypothetical protein